MTKKLSLILLAAAAVLFIMGYYLITEAGRVTPIVIKEAPVRFEENNPVPTFSTWEKDGRVFYYFNWGERPTSGYEIKLLGVEKNMIKLMAHSPRKDEITAQVRTYPWLLVSLPKGNYQYRVIDREGHPLIGIFVPENSPLRINLYLPVEGEFIERLVFRDLYQGKEVKTTAQIVLEAFFGQPEMEHFVNQGVNVRGASFSKDSWVILMTKPYNALARAEKRRLEKAIKKTVLALEARGLKHVKIVTDPRQLPPLDN